MQIGSLFVFSYVDEVLPRPPCCCLHELVQTVVIVGQKNQTKTKKDKYFTTVEKSRLSKGLEYKDVGLGIQL